MDLVDQIDQCIDCESCFDVCQSYVMTQEQMQSPLERLKVARKILCGEKVSSEEIECLYTCLKCGRCTRVCPQEIDISEVVRKAQGELLRKEMRLPLVQRVRQKMEAIRKMGNPPIGEPEKRGEWLPGEFPKKESDTLLYVGCMSSFWLKDIAISSYLLLEKLGVDFTIMKEEVCCGYFLYNMGGTDLAREQFEENRENFNRLGIRRIITFCPACYHTFKEWFPELLGKTDLEVFHLVQILPSLLRERNEAQRIRSPMNLEATYQDPCEIGRNVAEGIYEEPREILRLCGVRLAERQENREQALCCGGGGGVWGNFWSLALDIAGQLLDGVTTNNVVTSCPVCSLLLSQASEETERDNKVWYISQLVLDSLD